MRHGFAVVRSAQTHTVNRPRATLPRVCQMSNLVRSSFQLPKGDKAILLEGSACTPYIMEATDIGI